MSRFWSEGEAKHLSAGQGKRSSSTERGMWNIMALFVSMYSLNSVYTVYVAQVQSLWAEQKGGASRVFTRAELGACRSLLATRTCGCCWFGHRGSENQTPTPCAPRTCGCLVCSPGSCRTPKTAWRRPRTWRCDVWPRSFPRLCLCPDVERCLSNRRPQCGHSRQKRVQTCEMELAHCFLSPCYPLHDAADVRISAPVFWLLAGIFFCSLERTPQRSWEACQSFAFRFASIWNWLCLRERDPCAQSIIFWSLQIPVSSSGCQSLTSGLHTKFFEARNENSSEASFALTVDRSIAGMMQWPTVSLVHALGLSTLEVLGPSGALLSS